MRFWRLVQKLLSEEQFLLDHPAPALVLEPFTSDDPIGGGTQPIPVSSGAIADLLQAHGIGLDQLPNPNSRLDWIMNTGRHPFGSMVTVGRASNNDLILIHPTISKVHAVFHQTDDGWLLEDLDATNGTFLNGVLLEPKERTPIQDTDLVRIGANVVGRFLLPRTLWCVVQTAARVGMDATSFERTPIP